MHVKELKITIIKGLCMKNGISDICIITFSVEETIEMISVYLDINVDGTTLFRWHDVMMKFRARNFLVG